MRFLPTLGVWIVVLGAAACAHAPETNDVVITTGASVENHGAVSVLASAVCHREAECNNIGNGPYANRDICLDATTRAMNVTLNDANCPAGLSKKQVDKCVASIHYLQCENPLGPLHTFPECELRNLCKP